MRASASFHAPGARLLCAALVCGALACNGQINGEGSGVGGSTGAAGANPTGAGGSVGVGPGVDPGTKGLHRLNSAEYNATVADVLGTKLQPASSTWLGGEIGGFDNIAAVLDVDEPQYQRYFDAAGLIADDVFATPAAKARIMTCATQDATCVQSIIGATGKRLFRRPLATDEITTYNKVYTAATGLGETHELAIKQVLRAFLSSGEFLYRIETDPTPTSTAKHPLTAFELASRVSYFLWSSAPDDTLLAAATDNSLIQDATLRAQVDRMLMDPVKSQRFVENFSGQWLGARKLPAHGVDAAVYPDWTQPMADSLTKEMYMYFGEFVRTDRPWTEFMTADFNFVDAATAKIYGVTAPAGTGLQRMAITTDKRSGFAGLGGFLALSSLPKRTSPTLRARWILSNLLCQEPPPPPATGVPELGMSGGLDPTKNVRAALEDHRREAGCAACHAVFDPFGLALEQFDGIGKFRTTYSDGSTIDPAVVLQGVMFSGLEGMSSQVASNPKFTECVTRFMFTYGIGRLTTPADVGYLATVRDEWVKGTPSIRRLVQGLVLAENFRYRHATN